MGTYAVWLTLCWFFYFATHVMLFYISINKAVLPLYLCLWKQETVSDCNSRWWRLFIVLCTSVAWKLVSFINSLVLYAEQFAKFIGKEKHLGGCEKLFSLLQMPKLNKQVGHFHIRRKMAQFYSFCTSCQYLFLPNS